MYEGGAAKSMQRMNPQRAIGDDADAISAEPRGGGYDH